MKIELPQVGESVTEGIIGKWLKQVGDRVEKYDPLVEVVTDKVNMELPSPVSGILTAIVAVEGMTVPMGDVIAEIAVEGEVEEAAPGPAVAAPVVASAPETIDTTGVLLKDMAPVGPTGSGNIVEAPQPSEVPATTRRRYSPAVQRLAEEHGVDLLQVTGTGMNGRVTRKDVQSYLESTAAKPATPAAQPVRTGSPAATSESAPAGADEERVPLTPIRRLIAQNMVKSVTEIPQAWTMIEVDVNGLVQLRASVRDEFQQREGISITYLPFVVKAVAEALKENPLLNSSWGGDAVILKKRINIGIAVAASEGLVVPVIHDADRLSIAGIAKAIDDLTSRARQGKLVLNDVQGGTFTVNNTGVLGSVTSRPIVNYPQAAILTTEAIVKRPVVIGDAIAIRSIMNVTLTFDHRILDGAESGAFTSAIKRRLESINSETGIY